MNTPRHSYRKRLSFLAALLLCAAMGSSPAPAAASPLALSTGITQVGAGWQHTCALKSDGSLACWGDYNYGQLTLPSSNSGFTQLSAGYLHTCALKGDGSLACWGWNEYGQATPPSANNGFTQVSPGYDYTCALKSDSSLACWGRNEYGQITLPNPNSGFTQVSAGENHTCALKSDTTIACWGSNNSGQATPPTLNSGFIQVSTGGAHTCALKGDGSLACWGYNSSGQATPPTPNSGFIQVSAGLLHTCALKGDNSLACWGDNSRGQATPPTLNSGFIQVSAGGGHTCALKNDGALACWGENVLGQAPTISLSTALPASIGYGDSYSQALTASGGPGGGPYTFDSIAGALPPGLAIATGGTLSGTTTLAGNYTFTLRALDAIGYMGTRTYSLNVPRAPLTVRADDLTSACGSPTPPLTYTFSGLKNGDGPGAFGGTPPILLTNALPTSPPGTYPIFIMGGLTSPNYDITYATGWLRIEGAQLFLPAVRR